MRGGSSSRRWSSRRAPCRADHDGHRSPESPPGLLGDEVLRGPVERITDPALHVEAPPRAALRGRSPRARRSPLAGRTGGRAAAPSPFPFHLPLPLPASPFPLPPSPLPRTCSRTRTGTTGSSRSRSRFEFEFEVRVEGKGTGRGRRERERGEGRGRSERERGEGLCSFMAAQHAMRMPNPRGRVTPARGGRMFGA